MKEIVIHTLLDGFRLLPFLFATFLLIEYIEHKVNDKNIIKLSKTTKKIGPVMGSLLGMFPQCGFSVSATNLYAKKIITMGTLIAIYLSTSDEMLPIMISKRINIVTIIQILFLKFIIGFIIGFIIDFLLRRKKQLPNKSQINSNLNHKHCHCEKGILKSSIDHTINILIFILLTTFILNVAITYLGEDTLSKILLKNNLYGPFIAGLIGLIPNCASSVIITELYLHNAINFGSAMAGLLSGSGIGLLVLFKTNKNMKENFLILLIIYVVAVISGIFLHLIDFII
ncbi:MAG: arsenic efflux protein [Tenericutes bacterium]|nr:arsenic efflux protein [Mycoplasmatota bacterium]